MSIRGIPCSSRDFMCSALARTARTPPATRGWMVFKRPSIISGKPVTSETSRTESPASMSVRWVPPVEMSSTPSSARPRAKSAMPVLSVTLRSARWMFAMNLPVSHAGHPGADWEVETGTTLARSKGRHRSLRFMAPVRRRGYRPAFETFAFSGSVSSRSAVPNTCV